MEKKIPSFRAINSSLDLRVSDTRNHRKQHTKKILLPVLLTYVFIAFYLEQKQTELLELVDGGGFLLFKKFFKATFFLVRKFN